MDGAPADGGGGDVGLALDVSIDRGGDADFPTEEWMLLAPDGRRYDLFGSSVALSADGSRALVGANGSDRDAVYGMGGGSAHVYLRTGGGWAHEATLLPSGGASGFGNAVALSADATRALVAAEYDHTPGMYVGSARVFLRTGSVWVEEAMLVAAGGEWGGGPHDVALSADGSRALLGAPIRTAGGDGGGAHVFVRTGSVWVAEATLIASDGAPYDHLGNAVALSADGSRALVGAYFDDTADGADAGSARVFLRTGATWSEEATLIASDGAERDHFGVRVALSGDGGRALIGVFSDDTAHGQDAGSVRVFLRTDTTWSEEATLVASGGAAEDLLGSSVALTTDGSVALLGAFGDDTTGGMDAGSARLFLRTDTSWREAGMSLASDGADGDRFGTAVALDAYGRLALVGAYTDDTAAGIAAGSAHVFRLAP